MSAFPSIAAIELYYTTASLREQIDYIVLVPELVSDKQKMKGYA